MCEDQLVGKTTFKMGEDEQSIFVKSHISKVAHQHNVFSVNTVSFIYFFYTIMGHHIKSFTDGSSEV